MRVEVGILSRLLRVPTEEVPFEQMKEITK